MKFFRRNNDFFKGLIGSLILQATIYIFPSEAANFNNLSQTYIEINNVNQIPYEIGVDGYGKSTTIAHEGLLSSNLNINANFEVNTSILAYSQSEAMILGAATNYLADLRFSSLLIGKFFVLKDNFLKFDIQGLLGIFNATDDLLLGNNSTLGYINLFLINHTTKNTIELFKIFANLNNDLVNQNNLVFNVFPDLKLTFYKELIDLEVANKTIQTVFAGSFAKKFEQDTQVDLVIMTQSCNYASNIRDVCKIDPEPLNNFLQTIPEPSNNLAMIVCLIGLGSIKIFSRIINFMN